MFVLEVFFYFSRDLGILSSYSELLDVEQTGQALTGR